MYVPSPLSTTTVLMAFSRASVEPTARSDPPLAGLEGLVRPFGSPAFSTMRISTLAPPRMHGFPILSDVFSSHSHPSFSAVPTIPLSGWEGSLEDFAYAPAGTTVSTKGEPGREHAAWRMRTCSRYWPARPTEYAALCTSSNWPRACSVPGSTPPKANAIPDGSASISLRVGMFLNTAGASVGRPSVPTGADIARSFALRRAHCCMYCRREPGPSCTRDETSFWPFLTSVTHPVVRAALGSAALGARALAPLGTPTAAPLTGTNDAF